MAHRGRAGYRRERRDFLLELADYRPMNAPKRAPWTPWTDPICLLAWGAYFFNRFVLAPQLGRQLPFLHEHFNDSLLIPAALPLLYWLRFRLGLRPSDARPTWRDVMLWCAGWSLVFEWIGPRYFHYSVGDWGDVLAYFVGGTLAAACWNWGRENEVLEAKEGGRIGAAPLS